MLFNRTEKAIGQLRIVLRAFEQGLDKALDERQGRAQFMADIGHEFAAGIFQLFKASEVVKDEDRTMMRALGVNDSRSIDLQPTVFETRQFEFETADRALLLESLDQVSEQLQPKSLEDGLAADICVERKQKFQRIVDQDDAIRRVEDEDPFRHAVEQRLLMSLVLCGRAVMLVAERIIAATPPEV